MKEISKIFLVFVIKERIGVALASFDNDGLWVEASNFVFDSKTDVEIFLHMFDKKKIEFILVQKHPVGKAESVKLQNEVLEFIKNFGDQFRINLFLQPPLTLEGRFEKKRWEASSEEEEIAIRNLLNFLIMNRLIKPADAFKIKGNMFSTLAEKGLIH